MNADSTHSSTPDYRHTDQWQPSMNNQARPTDRYTALHASTKFRYHQLACQTHRNLSKLRCTVPHLLTEPNQAIFLLRKFRSMLPAYWHFQHDLRQFAIIHPGFESHCPAFAQLVHCESLPYALLHATTQHHICTYLKNITMTKRAIHPNI